MSRLVYFSAWIGLLLSSCTPTTGTRVSLTQDNLTKIKKIGLHLIEKEPFSVRLSREGMTTAGAALFGLVGATVEAAVLQYADSRVEEKFRPTIADFDPKKLMIERMEHYFQEAKVLDVIGINQESDSKIWKEKEANGILEVTIQEWGLRRCRGSSTGEHVQVGFSVQGKIFLLGDNTVVWERNEFYLDEECRPWQKFLSHEKLLKDALARTIDNLSGKLVNEILFP